MKGCSNNQLSNKRPAQYFVSEVNTIKVKELNKKEQKVFRGRGR